MDLLAPLTPIPTELADIRRLYREIPPNQLAIPAHLNRVSHRIGNVITTLRDIQINLYTAARRAERALNDNSNIFSV